MNINITIKLIVLVHFLLSVWGSMGNYLPATYIYVNAGAVVCGLWAIAQPQSPDAVIMTLIALLLSMVEDIILLALYEPRGYNAYEEGNVSPSARNEYRFALGMGIANVILKPFSAGLLYRVLQARNSEADFSIPGIDRIPGIGGGLRGGYSDIDHSPDSHPYAPVDTNEPPAPHTGSADKE